MSSLLFFALGYCTGCALTFGLIFLGYSLKPRRES